MVQFAHLVGSAADVEKENVICGASETIEVERKGAMALHRRRQMPLEVVIGDFGSEGKHQGHVCRDHLDQWVESAPQPFDRDHVGGGRDDQDRAPSRHNDRLA